MSYTLVFVGDTHMGYILEVGIMTKKPADDLHAPRTLFNHEEQKLHDDEHDIDNYKMACLWYKNHLMRAILKEIPPSGPLVEWTDGNVLWMDKSCEDIKIADEWIDALHNAIKEKQENLFYQELKRNQSFIREPTSRPGTV